MPLRNKCAVLLRTPRAIKLALEVIAELEREREEHRREQKARERSAKTKTRA